MENNTTSSSLSAEVIKEKILRSRGQFVKASWKSNPKPKAEFKGILLEKHTVAVIRSGVDFANLSSVKGGIADGSRPEVGELPYGRWAVDLEGNSLFPYIIAVDDKITGEEKLQLRMYPSSASNHRPIVTYLVNGDIVDKQKFASFLTPSESKKLLDDEKEKPLCFNVKMENILSIPEDVID